MMRVRRVISWTSANQSAATHSPLAQLFSDGLETSESLGTTKDFFSLVDKAFSLSRQEEWRLTRGGRRKKRGMNSKSPPASTVRKVSFRDQFCSLLESKQEFSPAEQKFFDSFLRPDKICPRDVSQKCSLQNSSNETGRAHFD